MSRFFLSYTEDNTAVIKGDEAAHMLKTLRMKPGDGFTGIDGSGFEYKCVIDRIEKDAIKAAVLEKAVCRAEPKIALTIYQAYPKAAKIETILQKCVELGISAFVPFISERCVKKPGSESIVKRLLRVAKEAVKQCGRAKMPEVFGILAFDEVIKRLSGHELKILALEEEKDTHFKQVLQNNRNVKDIAVIIGPEGGFGLKEAEAFIKAGALSVTLGKRVLRTETAAPAVSAIVMYELEGDEA